MISAMTAPIAIRMPANAAFAPKAPLVAVDAGLAVTVGLAGANEFVTGGVDMGEDVTWSALEG